MEGLLSALAVILLLFPTGTQGQEKKADTPAAYQLVSVQSLIQEGKIFEAVELASKNPEVLENAVQNLLESADLAIGDRQIAQAQAILDRTFLFIEAYSKTTGTQRVAREPLRGRQLRLEGVRWNDAKEYEKAVLPLRQALNISRETNDLRLEAAVHNNLGVALQSLNRLDEARNEFEAAVRIADEQKDAFRAGSSLFNLGRVLLQSNQFEGALATFKRAESRFNAASRTSLEARSIMMQGLTLGRADEKSVEAVRDLERAQKVYQDIGDRRSAGWIYYLIGDHIAKNQKFAEAAEYGEKAIPYLREAADKASLQQCYEFLASVYEKAGGQDQAEKYRKLAGEKARN